MFSSVDLPQPEWPISTTSSPLETSRLIRSSADTRPAGVTKDWETFWTRSRGRCSDRLRSDMVRHPLRYDVEQAIQQQAGQADHHDRRDHPLQTQGVPAIP